MLSADEFAIRKAITKSDLSPIARSVLIALISFTDKEGECFPSVSALMEQCGYCDRTVRSKLKELVDKGWLIKTAQFRKNGSQTSNYYVIQQPQKSEKNEKIEENNQLGIEDRGQRIDMLATKAMGQPAEENIIAVGPDKNNPELQVDLKESAQKKEALLCGATLPLVSASKQTSVDTIDNKPDVEPLSSVFLIAQKNCVVKSFCEKIWTNYAQFLGKFVGNLCHSQQKNHGHSTELIGASLSLQMLWEILNSIKFDFLFNIKDLR